MIDLSQFTVELLEAQLTDLHAEGRALKARKRAVVLALDRKRAEARAQALVDRLSDAEKKAVAQVIGATGIASGEAVGTPGAG